MIGEFESIAQCNSCDNEIVVSVILAQADATGEGFYKTFKENCGMCDEGCVDGELRLNPEFDFIKEKNKMKYRVIYTDIDFPLGENNIFKSLTSYKDAKQWVKLNDERWMPLILVDSSLQNIDGLLKEVMAHILINNKNNFKRKGENKNDI